MNIGQELCKALGLEGKKVTRIQMNFETNKAEAVVTFIDMNAEPNVAGEIVEVVKKYVLVERE